MLPAVQSDNFILSLQKLHTLFILFIYFPLLIGGLYRETHVTISLLMHLY